MVQDWSEVRGWGGDIEEKMQKGSESEDMDGGDIEEKMQKGSEVIMDGGDIKEKMNLQVADDVTSSTSSTRPALSWCTTPLWTS